MASQRTTLAALMRMKVKALRMKIPAVLIAIISNVALAI
jgi:hypothetical protein